MTRTRRTAPRRRGEGPPGTGGRRRGFARRHWKKLTLAGVVAAGIIGGALYWWRSTYWVSTDDAHVEGYLSPISARVDGYVVRVHVENNQHVDAGTLLVELDRTDYEVALKRAEADYADALAAAEAAKVHVPITSVTTRSQLTTAGAGLHNAHAGVAAAEKELDIARARLREAEANNVKAQADLVRFEKLVAKGAVTKEDYDAAVAAAASAAAAVDAAHAQVKATREAVAQARGRVRQAGAEVRSARTGPKQVSITASQAKSAEAAACRYRAALEQARLNLEYTRIVAPVSGIVGQRTAEIGQNVHPGQVLLYVVPLADVWVTANFKETQLKRIRPGQKARISVDTYGKTFDGYVESVGGASGALFSLFPPENATGNYVKVVQRFPVRLRFTKGQDREHPFRPGMSVVPKVRVK